MLASSHSLPSNVERVNDWLKRFSKYLSESNADELANMFSAGADWRDSVAFTWNITTFYGRDRIVEKLVELNDRARASEFNVATDRTLPRWVTRAGEYVLEGIYRFTTAAGEGAGVIRLLETEDGELKARTMLTSLQQLSGFEEKRGPRRPKGLDYSQSFGGKNWADLRRESREYTDREPEVLVVGAGQAGLAVAARLRTIGVDTLVIDSYPAVGDVWRKRYHSLTLHNESWVASMPYLEYPDTWPTYLPKDKLAGWLEYYAEAMELNVWTSTALVTGEYHEQARRWHVVVNREGQERLVKPEHVVICTGSVSGVPNIPDLPGLNTFGGEVIHSSKYNSEIGDQAKNAVVFGTGTSAHDVAQDLHARGCDVTMVQRNPTTVVSLEPSGVMVYALYSEGLPLEDADLISAANSYETQIRGNQLLVEKMLEEDRDLLNRLHAVGFRTDVGEDKTGFHLKYSRRGGGYYINVGASDLIADREIKLIQMEEFDSFVSQGIKLKDGHILDCDLAVLATGYRNQQEDVRRWFGNDVADKVGPIWGIDYDGEMRNVWRPTPQEGLWFNAGSLAACRANSKYLALLIKAELEGISPERATQELKV